MTPPSIAAPLRTLHVAVIGNPNTGKSTLFTALTGVHSRIGNFPGVTVEKKLGRMKSGEQEIVLVDLPGTYSLSARTLDERVSVDVLLGRQREIGEIDAILCIVDASNLERNLYLYSQLRDLHLPIVLVLNMMDLAAEKGVRVDTAALQERLQVPVIACEAHRRTNLDAIRSALVSVAGQPVSPPPQVFPTSFYEVQSELQSQLAAKTSDAWPKPLVERLLLDVGGQLEQDLLAEQPGLVGDLTGFRERLQAAGCRVPAAEAKARYAWARSTLQGISQRPTIHEVSWSDRLDHILTHRFIGLILFCLLMFGVFQMLYIGAKPLMGAFEMAQGWIGDKVSEALAPGPLRSLLVDGVIAGVGGVLVFLPQIVLLFLVIAILEDCGYLARAAFLMDRLMTSVGLSGKSFVPLMSSFACAIPGVMATRVIENRRDRMVTILVAPLMSCSARLPVYTLLISAFVPATLLWGVISLQGATLFAALSIGAIVAIPVAWLFKRFLFPGETPPFVMELPTYKWPSPRIVLARVYDQAKAFVVRAGTLIFLSSMVIWGAGYFPGDHRQADEWQAKYETNQRAIDQQVETVETFTALENRTPEQKEALRAEQANLNERLPELEIEQAKLSEDLNRENGRLLESSLLGRFGHLIEPAVRPLGWDWRIGVGVVASFPAREVIIATLGTIYSLGGDVDEGSDDLKSAMAASTWPNGEKVFNIPVALSVIVFFALCAQCAATLAVIKRETNSWGWPLFTFTYMTALAYLGALLTYQIGRLWI